jgi:hypothetical protein
MANGAFKFKDNSGNVVASIGNNGSNIVITGGTLDLSGMSGLTMGNVTMSGTTENATSASHAASYLLTSSFNTYTGNTNTIIGTLATTGSNQFKSDQVITGSLTVTGFIDAQELRTTYISSSILYRSGSTKFGDEISDTHSFTGSLLLSGSLTTSNIGVGTTDLGPDGISLSVQNNYSWSEGSGNAYATLFRQRNSAATVIASGYKRSNTASFASSYGISISRSAIAVGYNNGSIAFFTDTATNVANGTDMTPTERVTILNSGNMGVGTTTPTGIYGKLSVAGGISILDDNNGKLELGRYSSGVANSYIKLGANSNSLRVTNNTDTVDVFTFTNTGVLDLNGDNAISSINDKFALGVSGTSHAWIQSFGGRPLVLQGSGNNVGIGTTNPVTNLQLGRVFGFVQDINSGYIQANMASNGNYIVSQFATRVHLDSALGEINFLNAASGTAGSSVSLVNRMRIASDGRVGVGTGASAPPEPLSVSFDAHGLISQHRQSNGVGVGQNFFMKFNNAAGSAVSYAGIYADIQSNTTGAHRGRMLLQTANAGSLASVLSLTSSGVQFGGTGSNLNNYEEGTWTPSIVGGGGGESTYSSHRAGWYTRVGRLVTITWFVVITKNNMSGTLRMTGLPFTLINGSGVFYPQGTVLLDSLSTTTNNITFQAANNTNSGDFIAGNGSTVTHTGLPISVLGSGTMECRGTVTYFTS